MKRSSGFKWIIAAMFASMTCICTLCVQIALPMGGYINLGDALVLMGAFLMGRKYGALAAGIGAALADVVSGYAFYAPGTLVIKAATAFVAAALVCGERPHMPITLRRALAGLAGETVMVLGYLAYEWFLLSNGSAALANLPGNAVQGAAGVLLAVLIVPLISKPREIQEMLAAFRDKKD